MAYFSFLAYNGDFMRALRAALFCFALLALCACAVYGTPNMRHPGALLDADVTVITLTPDTLPEPVPAAHAPPPQKPYHYRLGEGDVLHLRFFEHASQRDMVATNLSDKQAGVTIDNDGAVYFPPLGDVTLAGLTVKEARTRLLERLKAFYREPYLDIEVLEYHSRRIQVTGEVNRPGEQTATHSLPTVLSVLAQANGVTDSADLTEAVITRRTGEKENVDLHALLHEGDQRWNLTLAAGDTLHVPRNHGNRVFVLGEVNQPAAQSIQFRRTTLADILAQAGNLNLVTGDPAGIYVIRGEGGNSDGAAYSPGGKKTVYHLNARNPEGLLAADRFVMQPRDIVFVAASQVTQWNRIISQLIPSQLSQAADVRHTDKL